MHPDLTHYQHTDMVPRRKIVRSREHKVSTNELEITKQASAASNRPLTQAEKRARAGFGWVIRQEDENG